MHIETTWGTIRIESAAGRAVSCRLPFLDGSPDVPFAVKNAGHDPASRFVIASLTGHPAERPPLAILDGTAFQQQIWQVIAAIPAGHTQTYSELAQAIGRPRACRAVANACGKNPLPIFIPCHRVVAANGGLGGFSAGVPWKLLLLEMEQSNPHG